MEINKKIKKIMEISKISKKNSKLKFRALAKKLTLSNVDRKHSLDEISSIINLFFLSKFIISFLSLFKEIYIHFLDYFLIIIIIIYNESFKRIKSSLPSILYFKIFENFKLFIFYLLLFSHSTIFQTDIIIKCIILFFYSLYFFIPYDDNNLRPNLSPDRLIHIAKGDREFKFKFKFKLKKFKNKNDIKKTETIRSIKLKKREKRSRRKI